jgi:hypothetical protein
VPLGEPEALPEPDSDADDDDDSLSLSLDDAERRVVVRDGASHARARTHLSLLLSSSSQ